MSGAAIFNSGTVKILKDILQFKSTNKITMQGAVDPTVTAVDGLIGDLYVRASNGAVYKKTVSGLNTNWSEILDAAAVSSIVSAYIPLTQKGAVNGVVPLNGAGKIDTQYIPGSYIQYKGMWNASTNTPTLADGTGTAGWFYEVNVAGTQNLGSGSQSFKVGDWVVYDGSIWDISTNSNEVVSVNGLSGAVTLTTTDIAEGTNFYFTNGRWDARLATKTTSDLAEGVNLYYTATRFNAAFAAKSTTDLSEGTNLYFTTARAKSATVSDAIVDGITDVAPSQNAVFDALALKANTTLSNLGTTNINANLRFDTDAAYDIGSTTKAAASVFIGTLFSNGTMNIIARLSAAMNFVAAAFRFSNSNGTTGASIQLYTGGDANTIGLTAPTTVAANVNYILPAAPTVSGQLLSSTTGGLMSWTSAATFVAPTIQKFTSGSGTYTTPANVKYINVKMVGAGGGGGGSGTTSTGNGGTGGDSSFGTSLLNCVGGSGGTGGPASSGGTGGTSSLGTGPVGTTLQGGAGSAGFNLNTATQYPGGVGGVNPFGGSAGAISNGASVNAVSNTGAGGAGAGTGGTALSYPGSGAGAGGFVDALIYNPLATYAYTVGAAGTAGTAGTGGNAGGDGGSGYIVVTEYYN
jgi:hypothetical protein